MRWVIFSLSILISLSANARLGETPQQCQERYGKPVNSEANECDYFKAGFYITIKYIDGKAAIIGYFKIEKEDPSLHKEISDNEINTLLSANGGDREWRKMDVVSVNKQWQTSDGERFAQYDVIDPFLCIFTKEYMKVHDEKRAEQERKNLEGF